MAQRAGSDASSLLARAWETTLAGLDEIRQGLLACAWARHPAEAVRAQRFLLQAQAAAWNLVVAPDPARPAFQLGTVFEPNVYTWLMPNPDCVYRYAFVDGSRPFEIRGVTGAAHIVELQVIGYGPTSTVRLKPELGNMGRSLPK